VDFVIAFVILLGMMVVYGVRPTPAVFLVPVFLLLALVTALGVGMWLSALNVEYRDVRYVIPFLTQLWLFATPVAYPSSLLAEPFRTIYGINPMVGVVDGFRWALLGSAPPGPTIGLSAAVSVALLVTGGFYFRRMERTFADVV
jgi:lipopolysaccharide transport system permease protein